MKKTRILFVCWGNICRSTMSQSVMAHLLRKAGRTDVEVDSAGVSDEEEGNPPHQGTCRRLRQAGIDVVPHRARMMTRVDLETFDRILVADETCLQRLHRRFRGDYPARVELQMSLAGEERSIADPWCTGNFDVTFADVMRSCQALLAQLAEE